MGTFEKKSVSVSRLVLRNILISIAAILIAVAPGVDLLAQTPEQLEYYSERVSLGTENVKRDALAALRRYENAKASRIAEKALSDESVVVRATAINAVVFLPQRDASSLVVPFLSDKFEFLRKEAVYALAEIGDPNTAGLLIRVMNEDKKYRVRSAAAFALGRIGNLVAISPLITVLQKKPRKSRAFLRRSAARSIGQIAEALGGMKATDNTPESFLPDKLKTATPVAPITSRVFANAADTLETVLSNPKEAADTRREAAFALGAIGSKSASRTLRRFAAGTDYILAEVCREALIKIDGN